MKKIIVVIMLLFACLYSEAQKFLRYQMNNNTYNGFYTNGIGSILHGYKNGIATTFVNAYGKVYEIPINDIDCISVEDANISNGDIGQYRIFEFNYEEDDVKKVYVDNRASLFASHNGDFGANDTILFSSAYNNVAWLFYTDGQGRIKKFFDGDRLMFFDYDSDSEFTIFDLSTGATYPNILAKRYLAKSDRAPSFETSHFFRNYIQYIQYANTQSTSSALNLANNIDAVQNDPELHNQKISNDWEKIGIDLLGVINAIRNTVLTDGMAAPQFCLAVGSLYESSVDLFNDIWPDSEQMQRYCDYYQRKYSIIIAALEPENVSYTSASLRGHIYSEERLDGDFTFTLYGKKDQQIFGVKNTVSDGYCKITAEANKLEPGWTYFYSITYNCVVDGLLLDFHADNIMVFTTIAPSVYTGEVHSKSTDRAEVICRYYNFPEGTVCGVEYTCDGKIIEDKADATHEGDYYFTLSSLEPNKTYTYRAFVVIDGIYVYAEESKQFTTGSTAYQECPDENHPHWIDLELPSGTLWSCCNVGASAPEEYGEYFSFVQIFSAPSREQFEELINHENTFYKFKNQNGVSGEEFRGKNGGILFFPFAGTYYPAGETYSSESYNQVGSAGFYWSSTLDYEYRPEMFSYQLFISKAIPECRSFHYASYWNDKYHYDIRQSLRQVRLK